mmetsp:Transcript_8290/g.12958  ORF Transcript_8290/g.12958 Transcript_8290/m.12958 type:complete len:292 (-) Transcript_8290:543-1418(-)
MSGLSALQWATEHKGTAKKDPEDVLKLVVNQQGLLRVPSLDPFTNLKEIYMHNNQIYNLPKLSGLKNLEYIYVPRNRLEKIPDVRGLVNLLLFDVSRNDIEEVDVERLQGLTRLVNLDLSHNRLSKFPSLSFIKPLLRVELDFNRLTSADFTGMQNLRIVSLGNNWLEKAPKLSHLKKLQQLNLKNNRLKTPPNFSPGSFSSLTKLDIRNNPLSEEDVKKFDKELKIRNSTVKLLQGISFENNADAKRAKIAELETKIRNLMQDNQRVKRVVSREIIALSSHTAFVQIKSI